MARPRQSSTHQKRLTQAQWTRAVDIYELGYRNQRQLAEQFGISLTAMHKGLKKRGAVKGRRVEETLVDLKRELARKRAVRLEAAQQQRARMQDRTAMLEAMMNLLLQADRDGNLAAVGPVIDQVRRSM